jgi:hypothetical protein
MQMTEDSGYTGGDAVSGSGTFVPYFKWNHVQLAGIY